MLDLIQNDAFAAFAIIGGGIVLLGNATVAIYDWLVDRIDRGERL